MVSHVVFQHIPDPQVTYGYVAEMGRVLRPGGFGAFQVSNDPSIHRGTRLVADRVKAVVGRWPKGQGEPQRLGSAVDLDELSATAQRASLALERIEGEGTQFCLVLARRS